MMADPLRDEDFEQVPAGTFTPNPCSPDLLSTYDFRGIQLNAPRELLYDGESRDRFHGTFARVLVCGAYHLDSDYLDLREQFMPRILLVAVDARTHEARAEHFETAPNALEPASPFDTMRLGPDDLRGRSIIEYFNVDLVHVLSLPEPEIEAEYLVYAVLGSYVSNVVRISVRKRGKRR
jgi:hypothetical protein